MVPGARSTFGAPRSNLRYFRSKCRVLNKVLVTLLRLFGDPAVIRDPIVTARPGNCVPLSPLVMSLVKVELRTACIKNGKLKVIKIRRGFQYVGYFITAAKT